MDARRRGRISEYLVGGAAARAQRGSLATSSSVVLHSFSQVIASLLVNFFSVIEAATGERCIPGLAFKLQNAVEVR
jgi:hypothetical protein